MSCDLYIVHSERLIPINKKSRTNHPVYMDNNYVRYNVRDTFLSWDINSKTYSNIIKSTYNFTHDSVLNSSLEIAKDTVFTKSKWGDPPIQYINYITDPNWKYFNLNNRKSLEKTFLRNNKYLIDGENNSELKSGIFGAPLYPGGRTGLCGRGLLGKWGPNQAADPIITFTHPVTKILNMIGIIRKDTNELAIPGGMVDPGEKAKTAALRELFEESLGETNELGSLKDIFTKYAVEIYSGIVDDPRNTDNAWMETSVYHLHIENIDIINAIEKKLIGCDDAMAAKFVPIEPVPELYASHKSFIEMAINRVHNSTFVYINKSIIDKKNINKNKKKKKRKKKKKSHNHKNLK